MNSIVVYSTTSGNTMKIAQAIHRGMKRVSQPDEKCDIAWIKRVNSQDLANYDLIGIGGPVMHNRELGDVTKFVEQTMATAEGKHSFAFCTHGALPGRFLSRVVAGMGQRGLTVVGWNNWFCSVFHPVCPKPYFTDGHPDEVDLREAEDFGTELVIRSRRIYLGETQLIPAFPRGREYDKIYQPLFLKLREEMETTSEAAQSSLEPRREGGPRNMADAKTVVFKVDRTKCKYPKCTLCIDHCPMDAIDMSVEPPLFNMDCEKCWLCEMACPQGAIEVDFGPFQSVHQIIPGESALEKSMELFEAQGRFRRLVPLEDIGWDASFHTFPKPRYKFGKRI